MRVDIIISIAVVIVKFKPLDFHKYGRSYKTSNRSKAHYINTHPHQTRVSSTIFFTKKKKLEFLSVGDIFLCN